jgi:hypothetical protein
VVAEFEDPSNEASPLKVKFVPTTEEKDIVLKPSPLKGLRVRAYTVTVLLYENEAQSVPLATHTQLCRPTFNQDQLPGFISQGG